MTYRRLAILTKFLVSVGILCFVILPSPVLADTITDFSFSGSISCVFPINCTAAGTITGTFAVDTTTNSLKGPWNFTTRTGSAASTDAGAFAFLSNGALGIVDTNFALALDFAPTNPFSGGGTTFGSLVIPGQILNVAGTAADPVSVPEPSSVLLLGIGLLGVALASVFRADLFSVKKGSRNAPDALDGGGLRTTRP